MLRQLPLAVYVLMFTQLAFISGCAKEAPALVDDNIVTEPRRDEDTLDVRMNDDSHYEALSPVAAGPLNFISADTVLDLANSQKNVIEEYFTDANQQGFAWDHYQSLAVTAQQVLGAINTQFLIDILEENKVLIDGLSLPEGLNVEAGVTEFIPGRREFQYRISQLFEKPNCSLIELNCNVLINADVSISLEDNTFSVSKNVKSNSYYINVENIVSEIKSFTIKDEDSLLELYRGGRGDAYGAVRLAIDLALDNDNQLLSISHAVTGFRTLLGSRFALAGQEGKGGRRAFTLRADMGGTIGSFDQTHNIASGTINTQLRDTELWNVFFKGTSDWYQEYLSLDQCDSTDITFPDAMFAVDLRCSSAIDPSSIESLISLRTLTITNGSFDTLDLSKFSNLVNLSLIDTPLTDLRFPKKSNLKSLTIVRSNLSGLDLSEQKALSTLVLEGNPLAAIELPIATELSVSDDQTNSKKSALVSNTLITSNQLGRVKIVDSPLTDLDLSHSTFLRDLYLDNLMISSLSVTDSTVLTVLTVNNTLLQSLDLSLLRSLNRVDVSDNQLDLLSLLGNASLSRLDASNNRLVTVNLSEASRLTHVTLESNALTELDTSTLVGLGHLVVDSNQLTELDVSNSPSLSFVSVNDNLLTSIDMSSNVELSTAYFKGNPISDLNMRFDASIVLDIDEIGLSDALLDTIDLMPKLRLNRVGTQPAERLSIVDIALDCALTVQNVLHPETVIHLLCYNLEKEYDFTVLTSLESFDVKGISTIQSLDFSSNLFLKDIDIERGALSSLVLPQSSSLESLRVYFNPDLESIDLTVAPNLKSLDLLYLWRMTAVDVSKNVMLEEVWLEGLSFSSLDFSNNKELRKLVINEIKTEELTLDLSSNLLLSELSLSSTPISELDLSANINLIMIGYGVYHGILCDEVVLPPTKVSFECRDPFGGSKYRALGGG